MAAKKPDAGPTLETYVETRFNLLVETINEKIHGQDEALKTFQETTKTMMGVLKITLESMQIASDLRHAQRFDALKETIAVTFQAHEKAVQAALSAADRAVSKAELASDKRFESVNEFRKTLADQQQTFMPRAESVALHRATADRLAGLKEQIDAMTAERMGIRGGWGYAVGVVGFLLALGSLGILLMKLFEKP